MLGGTTWLSGGFWAPDGAYSRFVSPIIGLVWVVAVSRILLTRSPATRAGWVTTAGRDFGGRAASGVTQRVWRPLQASLFRRTLAASLIVDLGSFMQSIGAAWLMVSMQTGPFYVALTQTASTTQPTLMLPVVS